MSEVIEHLISKAYQAYQKAFGKASAVRDATSEILNRALNKTIDKDLYKDLYKNFEALEKTLKKTLEKTLENILNMDHYKECYESFKALDKDFKDLDMNIKARDIDLGTDLCKSLEALEKPFYTDLHKDLEALENTLKNNHATLSQHNADHAAAHAACMAAIELRKAAIELREARLKRAIAWAHYMFRHAHASQDHTTRPNHVHSLAVKSFRDYAIQTPLETELYALAEVLETFNNLLVTLEADSKTRLAALKDLQAISAPLMEAADARGTNYTEVDFIDAETIKATLDTIAAARKSHQTTCEAITDFNKVNADFHKANTGVNAEASNDSTWSIILKFFTKPKETDTNKSAEVSYTYPDTGRY